MVAHLSRLHLIILDGMAIFLPRSLLQAKPVQYSNAQNLLVLFLPQVNYSRKSVTSNSSEDTKITL